MAKGNLVQILNSKEHYQRDFKDTFQLSLKYEEFVQTNKRAIITKAKVERQEVTAIIEWVVQESLL